jgi:hypothetical protein
MMSSLVADLRHALRTLRRSPGFGAAAVATLALGIGANTAIFSVVHAVLLKPLGFPHPERLVTLEERDQNGAADNTGFPTYLDWRARTKSFEEMAVTSYWSPTLAADSGSEAEKLEGMRVTAGFFRMLGVRPAVGRDFLTDEDRPGANRVVLLSHGLWTRRFGADPSIAGRTIQISDRSYVISGVVARRVREIGIRIAMGARRGQILRLVVGEALALATAGVAAAVPLALGFGSVLKSQLYAVSPGDGATLAVVACLALAIAFFASLTPAQRATHISPLTALRSE